MARALRRGLLILLSAVVLAATFACIRYRGLGRAVVHEWWYATPRDARGLINMGWYWGAFLDKLRYDPDQRVYHFGPLLREMEPNSGANRLERAQVLFHQGDFEHAARDLKADVDANGESEETLFWQALTEMRLAETVNCLEGLMHDSTQGNTSLSPQAFPSGITLHGDHGLGRSTMCVVPLASFHEQPSHSEQAMAYWIRLLDTFNPEDSLYRWLLNFSAMTINRYPGGVPERYRITGDFQQYFYGATRKEREAAYADLSFTDRARALGVDTFHSGKGLAVEDFDRDGYLDIITGGFYDDDLRLYHNDHGKTFIDQTDPAGLRGFRQTHIMSAADYDNDGWVDLVVSRPWEVPLLLHNEKGRFVDVTTSMGLVTAEQMKEARRWFTWAQAWADVDLDGDLDLFLTDLGLRAPISVLEKKPQSSRLYINEGTRFVDRTEEWGLLRWLADTPFFGVAFGDEDGDGYPDLFVSSPLTETSMLFHNASGRRFEKSPQVFPEKGFTAAFVDVDHDGDLDLFQAGVTTARSSAERAMFHKNIGEYRGGYSAIFVQDGGRLTRREDAFEGELPANVMGASFGDLNNDGCFDFYLGTGNPEPWYFMPNLMYAGKRNGSSCTGTGENISMLQGFGNIQKGHGIVFFDFDEDGDQDVYSVLGGGWPGDKWVDQFFVNDSHLAGNSWIKLRLRGHRTNYYGVGARISVYTADDAGTPIVRRYFMDAGTGFGSKPYLAHIGLYKAKRVDRVEVYWPVSRETRVYHPEILQTTVLDENDGSIVTTAAR